MGEEIYGWSKSQLWFNGKPLGFIENSSMSIMEDASCPVKGNSCITDSIATFSVALTISTAEMKKIKLWFDRLVNKRRKRIQFRPESNRTRKKQRLTRLQRRKKRQLS